MSIANFYVEPGIYPEYEPSESFPVVPGGVRVVAIIGAGKVTKDVAGKSITKGTINSKDTLEATGTVTAISRVYTDTVEYEAGVDYQLTSNKVDWSLVIKAALTSGEAGDYDFFAGEATPVAKTIIFSVDGGAYQTVTLNVLPTPADYSAQDVVDAINAQTSGCTASVETVIADEYVKITSDATNGSSIVFGAGTANTVLGFSDGLANEGSKEPVAASTYYVDYTRARLTTEYTAQYWYSMVAIINEFGPADTTSPISLASQIAYENGATVWLLAQTNAADGSEYQQYVAALAKLTAKDCNIVVPITTNQNIFSIVKSHVVSMSTQLQRKWRIAFIGVTGSKTVSQMNTLATGLNSRRVVLVYPEVAKRMIGDTETSLDGSYIAAALAGINANPNYDVATPLTRKDVVGFTELVANLNLRTEKNSIASNGVCIVDFDGTNSRVRHGKTTAIDTVINQEISLTNITDYVSEVMYRALENIYTGRKIVDDTTLDVKVTIQSLLNQLVGNDILVGWQNITVTQNITDPTQIDVTFEISPVMPLNYINIVFSINL